nr:hypothetical protein [Mycoplasmopsis bovis]
MEIKTRETDTKTVEGEKKPEGNKNLKKIKHLSENKTPGENKTPDERKSWGRLDKQWHWLRWKSSLR